MRRHDLDEAEHRPPGGTADVPEIAPDGAGLAGKGLGEALLVGVLAGGDREVEARIDEPVVMVGHPDPFQLPAGQVVEVGANETTGFELPDVVHADVPGRAVPPEGVGEPAGFAVLLQHENPLASDTRQQPCCGQPANPRSDHDDVVHSGSVPSKLFDNV